MLLSWGSNSMENSPAFIDKISMFCCGYGKNFKHLNGDNNQYAMRNITYDYPNLAMCQTISEDYLPSDVGQWLVGIDDK